jgi:hypothetical protein
MGPVSSTDLYQPRRRVGGLQYSALPLALLLPLTAAGTGACTSLKSSDDVLRPVAEEAGLMEEPPDAGGRDGSTGAQDAEGAEDAAEAGQVDVERCSATEKPQIPVADDINTSTTWSCEFDYVLKQLVRVNEGATLTIEAGTTVRAAQGQAPPNYVEPGALIVARGGKIQAVGTPTQPIVFTSAATPPSTKGSPRSRASPRAPSTAGRMTRTRAARCASCASSTPASR